MAGLRFLIIDPDRNSADTINDHLKSIGFLPVCVDNAEQGLQLIQTGDFEVVIATIISPISNDIDFFKQIALSEKIEEVVVITNPKHKKQAIEAFGVSVWAYLLTPVDGDELKAIVNRISGFSCLSRDVTDKAKRVSHLEVINEIAREALLQEDSDKLMWLIVRLIHEKLNFYNVNIFEIDDREKRAVLKAFAGGYGDDLVVGYSLRLGEGMVGWTAQNRQSLLSGDAQNEPRRIQGFDFEKHVHSELSVPIMFNDRVLGVLHVESGERHAFSRDDVMVLETLADQISLTLEKMRLSHELLDSYELGASVNDSLPVSIIILNQDLMINYVNKTFCEISGRSREEFINKPIEHALSPELRNTIDLDNGLRSVLKTGNSIIHNNIRHASFSHSDKILSISLVRVRSGESPRVMILIRDVTETTEKTYQLTMLREISIAMQGILERDKLLHLILTCVTAGFAFGFNRAFIFLVDEKRKELRGIMGVGPKTRDDAYRIWSELTGKGFTFHEYLDKIQKGEILPGELQDLVQEAVFDLDSTNNILTQTVNSGCHFHINNAWDNNGVDEGMRRMNISNEFVTIPLIAKNQVIGVLFADNAYSEKPITHESIEVLTMFASHAGLAIENARILLDLEEKVSELQEAYIELENTHDMLVRNEKLAAIGEVSARLAHEIRNPLSTIGGFAKSIPNKCDNKERTIRNANIIVEEVERLENILTNVLDFSKPSVPKKTLHDINQLVKSTLSIMESDIVSNSIVVSLDLSQEKLEAEFDETQIKQVLINVIQNAVNAMSAGGALEIITYQDNNEVILALKDTGNGIPEQYLDDIFEPFFTTRTNGTGLGLSISNRIVQNHRGRFEVKSKEGVGTTVTIALPIR
ncbi:MAG: GAF domain-containing protein [Candidatus Latescibacteria bacterium]|nr:GAF domain-containing protein [Candidatus Latescibacterota bacterium]